MSVCENRKVGLFQWGLSILQNVGSYSGDLLFTGLPFTVDGQNHPMPLGAHKLDSDNGTKNYLFMVTANNTTINVLNPNGTGAIGWSSVATGGYQVNGTYITA